VLGWLGRNLGLDVLVEAEVLFREEIWFSHSMNLALVIGKVELPGVLVTQVDVLAVFVVQHTNAT